MEEVPTKPLRRKYIDKVEDITDAMSLCYDYDVPDDGLQSFDDYIERLRLHYDMLKNGNFLTKVEESMCSAGGSDDGKRQQLVEMLGKLANIFSARDRPSNQHFVDEFLSKDGTTQNIVEDCRRRIEELKTKECVIMVAGETNAGKSSFLNLLLGIDILPEHATSCTSAITTIRYGTTLKAKITFADRAKEPIILDDMNNDHLITFKNAVFQKERDRKHGIKEVQLFLPVNFLKSGLVLADTPGIGETEYLEEYLMEYIANNEILGFIYIIFSDSCGGVKEDRLLNLLKMILEERKTSTKTFSFDPKAALFVANRFDAIDENSKELVKKHIINKLQDCWPEFEESMVVTFSTKLAKRDICACKEYVNHTYRNLLQAIRELFYHIIDRRIKVSFKWVENVLQRVRHCLKTAVSQLACSEKENIKRTKENQQRLKKLQDNAHTVIKSLRFNVTKRSQEVFCDLQQHLKTPLAMMRICAVWREDEIPAINTDIENTKHWLFVKERIDEAFFDRVCTEIGEWTDENEKVLQIENDLVKDIQTELNVIQNEIIHSEHDMNDSKTDSDSGRDSYRGKWGTLKRKSIIAQSDLIEIPMRLPTKVKHRFYSFSRGRDTKRFLNNPEKWTKARSEKLLKRLVKNEKVDGESKGSLDMLVEQLVQLPIATLDALERKLPSMVEANLDLLSSLKELRNHLRQNAEMYELMLGDIEALKQEFMEYGLGCIFAQDFKSNEILLTHTADQSLSQICLLKDDKKWLAYSGLWAHLYIGYLQNLQGIKDPILARVNKESLPKKETFREVAKLRCLQEDSIAEFLGIHYIEAYAPAYIYAGNLLPVRQYLKTAEDGNTKIKTMCLKTLEGLAFLHEKQLVHMEMTTDTVTVNETGTVKLTGACLPRTPPPPSDMLDSTKERVYLAPEVLRGNPYGPCADIYSFGLFVFELKTGTLPFEQERHSTLQHFVDTVNAVEMLDQNCAKNGNSFKMRDLQLLKLCVQTKGDDRISAANLIEKWNETSDDNLSSRKSVKIVGIPSTHPIW